MVVSTFLVLTSTLALGNLTLSHLPIEKGFAKLNFVSEKNMEGHQLVPAQKDQTIRAFCKDLVQKFQKYKWPDDPCVVQWSADLKTAKGYPLLYTSFGEGPNITLILGGVHPDELTPVHLSFRLANYLQAHPEAYSNPKKRIIIAPLVNPEGFLRPQPTRTNPVVDVNRNFITLDWYKKAIPLWRERRHADARYFPGYFPNTEIETLFQVLLIKDYHPTKILSSHAPLGFMDYDGPGDQLPVNLKTPIERQSKDFVHAVAKKSRNYRVVDYSFYPGSLGNYSGWEREIPTITLELETTHPKMVNEYWEKFLPGLLEAIDFPLSRQNFTKDH